MDDLIDARNALLELLAEETEMSFREVVRQYNSGGELRRRIDIAALFISATGTIH
jgi:hypothetical protein